MNEKIEVPTMQVPPLKKICMTIGQLPASYLETMSYYEMLVWFVNYLRDDIIPVVNANGEATEELQEMFVSLQNYVNTYFDNLDVQDEINNKIDEMIEQGTLQEIIADYLNSKAIFAFDNDSSLKSSTNLIDGSYARTIGKDEINDSYGSLYKITENPVQGLYNEELNSGLYANLINNQNNNYYDLNYTINRTGDTDYYLVTIPLHDENDNVIPIYVADNTGISPNQYAKENHTSLTINAGLTKQNSQLEWVQNIVIGNGQVLHGIAPDVTINDYNMYIGFDEDRELLEFNAQTTSVEDMISAGVKNGYMVFYRYVNNGAIEEHATAPNWNLKSPRMDIGIKQNGDIVILACDGRTFADSGLDDTTAATIMINAGCVKAFRTDGGGSTSLNIKENKINRNIDDKNTTDRLIDYTLNVKNTLRDVQNANLYSEISSRVQLMNKQIRTDLNSQQNNIYLQLENGTKNTIAAADTWQLIKFAGKYRHGNGIRTLTDNNEVVGFTAQGSGLIRVYLVVNYESNGSGQKMLRITKGNDNTVENLTVINVPDSSKQYRQFMCEVVLNNPNDETLPIKLWTRSEHAGDRLLRVTAYAETIGGAETS